MVLWLLLLMLLLMPWWLFLLMTEEKEHSSTQTYSLTLLFIVWECKSFKYIILLLVNLFFSANGHVFFQYINFKQFDLADRLSLCAKPKCQKMHGILHTDLFFLFSNPIMDRNYFIEI